MAWWWSWLLTGVGVVGLWLAGSRLSLGWLIGLAAQGLWIAYAVHSEQWGFLASALAYGTVYARNLARWRRDRQSTVESNLALLSHDHRPESTGDTP